MKESDKLILNGYNRAAIEQVGSLRLTREVIMAVEVQLHSVSLCPSVGKQPPGQEPRPVRTKMALILCKRLFDGDLGRLAFAVPMVVVRLRRRGRHETWRIKRLIARRGCERFGEGMPTG